MSELVKGFSGLKSTLNQLISLYPLISYIYIASKIANHKLYLINIFDLLRFLLGDHIDLF